MPESSQNNRFSSNDSQGETTSWQPPLGLQHPLVIANPLGQSFLSPQFLSPLGEQPLGGGNPLGSSAQALPDYNLSENFFQDSPSLAESRLSLNPPEVPVTTAATPTAGMDRTQVNIQRYPAEIPTATGHENNPIPAASDSLSEAERRLLGHDQAEVTTQELQVAAPHEQLGASDTAPLNPTVVQPQLATEPLLQREIATPEAPEAVEPLTESSVSESEPRVQIPEVAEEPPAIANANPSVMRSADLINLPPPQTSAVAPLPSLPTDHLSGIEPIVSSQAELSPVHPIESAQDTEQNTQDVPIVPVQRQEDEASPLVESLPLPNPAFSDASQSPQSFVQTQATVDSPPPINQPSAESPSAIIPVLASDAVSVQPSVPPNTDSESVAIAETSDLPRSTEGASPTEGESLQESGITPSEPTVVQAFSETESSPLSQTTAAPLESPVLTEPERHQSSTIGEPVADSSTPLVKPELETITSSYPPTIEEPQQQTETSRLDTDTALSHSEIIQPRLERELSAPADIISPTTPEASSIQRQALPQTEEAAPDAIAPPQEEALAAANITSPTAPEESAIQRQALPQTEQTAPDAIAPPQEEALAAANITSPTAPEESAIQRQALPQTEQTAPDVIAPTQEQAIAPADIISPTTPEASSIQRQALPQTEEMAPSVIAPTQEQAIAPADIISPTTPEASSIQKQALPQTEETAPSAIASAQEEAIAYPDITPPTAPEESSIQRHSLPETEEMAPDAIAPTQEEAIAHPNITSPTAPEESSIQRQLLPETEETPPSAITPTQEEAIAYPDITSLTAPEESSIQRHSLPETEETPPSAITPTQEEAIAYPDITSLTAPEESSIQRHSLPETEEMAPSAITPTQEEAIAHPGITSLTAPEESAIQRQLLPETEEMAPAAIAPTQEEAITHPDIISPTAPEESSIQRQSLPETEETAPSAIASLQEEALAPADITSPTSPEESAIHRQPLVETEETAPSAIAPHDITSPTAPEESSSQLDENTSFTEPIIPQPLLESDANLQSERLPTAKNPEEAQDNSPQISPVSPNSPPLPTHLLQTKTNVTGDESFNHNQDIPQLPTVLENLVGTRHTLPLIQPLHQQSSLLSTASTSEFSREPSTIVQSMPETSHRLVVPSTTPSTLPDDAFNQAQQSTVKVPPVSLDTEPLTLQRATDAIPKTTPESHQETQRVGNLTYTSEIPSSWSSIADLLDNTTNYASGFGGETPIQMAFNDLINQESFDLQESNNWENLLPEYSRSSEDSSTFSQETPIQKFTTEEASVQDEDSATEAAAQPQDAQHEDEKNLEILAREIYSLVQQRLAIERERYGHYY